MQAFLGKLLARMSKGAVSSAVSKKENRQKFLILFVVLIVSPFFIMVGGAVHVVTTPVRVLDKLVSSVKGFFGGDTKLQKEVEEFQKKYGTIQEIDSYEAGYTEGLHKDYSSIVFSSAAGDIKYENQLDIKFKGKTIGSTSDLVHGYGCGLTSLSMAVSTLSKGEVTVEEIGDFLSSRGLYVEGAGTTHIGISRAAREYGLSCSAVERDRDSLYKSLESGNLVIALMGPGTFTSGGHFILLRGLTESGKVLVVDPNSLDKSEKEWDIDLIVEEAYNREEATGAPFWEFKRKDNEERK